MAMKEIQSLDADKTYRIDDSGEENTTTEISGYYLGYREVVSTKYAGQITRLHLFQNDEGQVGVWGKKRMDQKLAGIPAPSNPITPTDGVAQFTTVRYNGEIENKGFPNSKDFKVLTDKENTIEISVALSAGLSSEVGAADSDDSNADIAAAYNPAAKAGAYGSGRANVSREHAAGVTNMLKKNK